MASKTTKRKKSARRKRNSKKSAAGFSLGNEILLLLILALCIIIFICLFDQGGAVGIGIRTVCFGAFGLMTYIFPIWLFLVSAFQIANRRKTIQVKLKTAAAVILFAFLCTFIYLLNDSFSGGNILTEINSCIQERNGGGLIGILIGGALVKAAGIACSFVITAIALIISLVIITEKSFLGGIKMGSSKVYHTARNDIQRRRGRYASRPVRAEQKRNTHSKKEEPQKQDTLSSRKLLRGVDLSNTKIEPVQVSAIHGRRNTMREIISTGENIPDKKKTETVQGQEKEPVQSTVKPEIHLANENVRKKDAGSVRNRNTDDFQTAEKNIHTPENGKSEAVHTQQTEEQPTKQTIHKNPKQDMEEIKNGVKNISAQIEKTPDQSSKYSFPPVSLLKKGDPNASGDSREHLQEMSARLQATLDNFGVRAHVTNVTCGPSVTRYEIQPEMGVKVSKIVSLTDDIKLNLAVPDIRMEAPIPGKAAIGIEVPNKENVTVAFRDLVESDEFKGHRSDIAFAVGKDISGNVIVADIAKMPHLLIAGATGSGKSVCINTIIMSILYKAHPNDVKLIMIDPKVVELSVYNGIPHLLIPVVTDPKKAAGALHWAVAEMTERYNKFAEYNVRDLKGYNKKAESISAGEDGKKPEKMPQIVIIVDELADLMMVAPGDVEDAICRLAQLARAAGIHLIIATQRPSVNVITGLIKANMPSRIAFSVTSGVDSRTILDMNGAEKLLGKGDMLFYPQGYQKPVRVQGAFVSDTEVSNVVDFMTAKNGQVNYNSEIEEKVKHAAASSGSQGGMGISSSDERDVYFAEAGKFVIEKEKGSIGMLQRMFKVGFNRAARIMDQLEAAGVVGPEEGTKPRKVLMTKEEFEQYIEECV